MSAKKKRAPKWTFESVCRAARKRGRWHLRAQKWWGAPMGSVVRCERGACPLGAVFPEVGRKIPFDDDYKIVGVPRAVWRQVFCAADKERSPRRARMLKLLGVRV